MVNGIHGKMVSMVRENNNGERVTMVRIGELLRTPVLETMYLPLGSLMFEPNSKCVCIVMYVH